MSKNSTAVRHRVQGKYHRKDKGAASVAIEALGRVVEVARPEETDKEADALPPEQAIGWSVWDGCRVVSLAFIPGSVDRIRGLDNKPVLCVVQKGSCAPVITFQLNYHLGDDDDDDVSFYNSTASTWTLATPRTTWESTT